MDYQEAIEVIKKNYPPENYTRLREALDLAVEALDDAEALRDGRIEIEEQD